MAKSRYYSPRLQHSLISPLYHAAKSHRVPMTVLASRLIAEGLDRMTVSAATEASAASNSIPIQGPGKAV